MIGFHILTIFLGFSGFLIAGYVHIKKGGKRPLVCPLKGECDVVIHSEYSKFLGIPIEFLGLFYYAAVAVAYGIFIAVPSFAAPEAVFVMLLFSTGAFCFSGYLTFIQAFVLRSWCTWCLTSAAISTTILASSLYTSNFNFMDLLWEHVGLLGTVHLAAIAVGFGAATVMDILFLRFLGDLRISKEEHGVLHMISEISWFVLAMIFISGAALFLPFRGVPDMVSAFAMQGILVLVIAVNSALLHFIVGRQLIDISLGEPHAHREGELHTLHGRAFAMGALSLVSWFSLFLVELLRDAGLSLQVLLTSYAALAVVAVTASQVLERVMRK